VDQEKKNGCFVLTGSHQLQVREAITQSLAGRTAILNLLPLSIAELRSAGIRFDSFEEYAFQCGSTFSMSLLKGLQRFRALAPEFAKLHSRFVIVRVMERGSLSEVQTVWRYYGPARIRKALLQAPALKPRTISFFAMQFGLPREAFRAWQREGVSCA
jgi:predicted AAA+ superfamily ATPase